MESKFAIKFRHWLKVHPRISSSFEIKDTRGKNYLPFSEVKQAQLDYGMAIKSDRGTLMRLQAVSEGMPDYIYLRNAPAILVINYPQGFVLIDIETFILEKQRSKTKSLSWTRASTISIKTVLLRNEKYNRIKI